MLDQPRLHDRQHTYSNCTELRRQCRHGWPTSWRSHGDVSRVLRASDSALHKIVVGLPGLRGHDVKAIGCGTDKLRSSILYESVGSLHSFVSALVSLADEPQEYSTRSHVHVIRPPQGAHHIIFKPVSTESSTVPGSFGVSGFTDAVTYGSRSVCISRTMRTSSQFPSGTLDAPMRARRCDFAFSFPAKNYPNLGPAGVLWCSATL